MADIYARVAGVIADVLADEGQLVAEGDQIATVQLDSTGEVVTIVTETPGVLRELFVDIGSAVDDGDAIAFIDEA